jgi:hypothetical protein
MCEPQVEFVYAQLMGVLNGWSVFDKGRTEIGTGKETGPRRTHHPKRPPKSRLRAPQGGPPPSCYPPPTGRRWLRGQDWRTPTFRSGEPEMRLTDRGVELLGGLTFLEDRADHLVYRQTLPRIRSGSHNRPSLT